MINNNNKNPSVLAIKADYANFTQLMGRSVALLGGAAGAYMVYNNPVVVREIGSYALSAIKNTLTVDELNDILMGYGKFLATALGGFLSYKISNPIGYVVHKLLEAIDDVVRNGPISLKQSLCSLISSLLKASYNFYMEHRFKISMLIPLICLCACTQELQSHGHLYVQDFIDFFIDHFILSENAIIPQCYALVNGALQTVMPQLSQLGILSMAVVVIRQALANINSLAAQSAVQKNIPLQTGQQKVAQQGLRPLPFTPTITTTISLQQPNFLDLQEAQKQKEKALDHREVQLDNFERQLDREILQQEQLAKDLKQREEQQKLQEKQFQEQMKAFEERVAQQVVLEQQLSDKEALQNQEAQKINQQENTIQLLKAKLKKQKKNQESIQNTLDKGLQNLEEQRRDLEIRMEQLLKGSQSSLNNSVPLPKPQQPQLPIIIQPIADPLKVVSLSQPLTPTGGPQGNLPPPFLPKAISLTNNNTVQNRPRQEQPADLLASIKAGRKLKEVDPKDQERPVDLLASIRAGRKLKKVDPKDVAQSSVSRETAAEKAHLKEAFQKMTAGLRGPKSSSSSSDGEW